MVAERKGVRLLNDMDPEERRRHEADKRFCLRCGQSKRTRIRQATSMATWNGTVLMPLRRFVNARIRVTEETWLCPVCQKAEKDPSTGLGLILDFEHIGDPGEIVNL